jgi:hypothetical protein
VDTARRAGSTAPLHGSNRKHSSNNNRSLISLNRSLLSSNSSNNLNNNRIRLLGLDMACVLCRIPPARRLVDLCGAVQVWALVGLALALEGSLVLARRIRRSGIRLRRITFLLRRARSYTGHRLHRIMGREHVLCLNS